MRGGLVLKGGEIGLLHGQMSVVYHQSHSREQPPGLVVDGLITRGEGKPEEMLRRNSCTIKPVNRRLHG